MDIKRDPAILRKKKIRQVALLSLAAIVVIVISVAVMRLRPAPPSVPGNTLWCGTVKRGSITREVHGAGTLVPEEIRVITARTSARVEKIVLRPGAQVRPGTVILELSNPDLVQQVHNAEMAWQTARAQLANQEATLNSRRLSQLSSIEDLKSRLAVAQADLDANKELEKQGLVGTLTVKGKQATVDQVTNSLELARKTLEMEAANYDSQIAPAKAAVNQQKSSFDLISEQLADLKVRSTMTGVLQVVSVEEGQNVGGGTALARVADPTRLKAVVRISETQTKDLTIGLQARVDTHSGIVKGHLTRIDPSSTGGTVGVDITIDESMPAGSRPDLSVDGTVELEKLTNILYVESPAFGQENTPISLFRVNLATGAAPTSTCTIGAEAERIPVKLGKRSVQFVEIAEGLREGQQVVLSDMSQYDAYDRIRIN
jgi:HlyD family secretion protein